MRFGPVPVTAAEGAILAHSERVAGVMLKKGRVLSAADVAALQAAGVTHVTVARLDAADIGEDEAALRFANALQGANVTGARPFTGRVNLFAGADGVLVLDVAAITAANACHESVTVATLAPFAPVRAGQMVATVKIIPFAVPEPVLAGAIAAAGRAAIAVSAYTAPTAALIQTRLGPTKDSVLDKTAQVMARRLADVGGRIASEQRTAHDAHALAPLIAAAERAHDMVLIVGASAITDRSDVIPAAIEAAGGRVRHFGMPVDPGNLLLLGEGASGRPVIGLPGCARSPKGNGVDWVVQRLAAGVAVTGADIMAMGVGGLLAEMAERPQPRAQRDADGETETHTRARRPNIAGLLLAAGQGRRMGGRHKVSEVLDGKPLVAHAADALLAGGCDPLIVVTGHRADETVHALGARTATAVFNPDYADGLSTSLKKGLAALPADVDGVLVGLADMPRVTAAEIARLIAAFAPAEGRAICVPTCNGKRGNPVLWSAAFIPDMMALKGDVGARHLIGTHADQVCEVPMDGPGVLTDVDTPEALARLSDGEG
jgi:molybdenum cofactor cytidylyltransferase